VAGSRLPGIGVAKYDNGYPELPRAVSDVEAVAALLAQDKEFINKIITLDTRTGARPRRWSSLSTAPSRDSGRCAWT
jgi:hypothetical protein